MSPSIPYSLTETPPAITDIPTLNDKILSLNTALKGSSLNYSDNYNTKYYCLGKLTLPQGGNHCYLKVLACYGFQRIRRRNTERISGLTPQIMPSMSISTAVTTLRQLCWKIGQLLILKDVITLALHKAQVFIRKV
jgi:hypothetical protein